MQITSASQPLQGAGSTSEDIIRVWIARFATNCGQVLSDARVLLWLDELAGIEPGRLDRACRAVMRSHAFNSIPQLGQIRTQLAGAMESATQGAAEIEWGRVLDLRRRYWNPDMPGGFSRGMPKLSERVDRAVRAAGIFALQDCEPEAIHVWARKRFIESYTAWDQMEESQFLLPDGEVKNLLAGAAETKKLARCGDEFRAARVAGEEYRDRMSAWVAEVSSIPRQIGRPARVWKSPEERAKAYAALEEKENSPTAMEELRRQKARHKELWPA